MGIDLKKGGKRIKKESNQQRFKGGAAIEVGREKASYPGSQRRTIFQRGGNAKLDQCCSSVRKWRSLLTLHRAVCIVIELGLGGKNLI